MNISRCSSALTTIATGLTFPTAAGQVIMRGRHVDKTMYLATCKGTEFDIIKTFADVKSGDECKA